MNRKQFCLALMGALLPIACAARVHLAREAQSLSDAKKQAALNLALIKAVRARDAKTVRALLARGADANARDTHAKPNDNGVVRPAFTSKPPTALRIAFDDARHYTGKRVRGEAEYKQRPDPSDIVQALLDKGADPNVDDYDGMFPLLLAAQNDYTASALLLLKHGADPNKMWVHGITPLHSAVDSKNVALVQALLAAGANRNAQSAFDNPNKPLHQQVTELLQTGHASQVPMPHR